MQQKVDARLALLEQAVKPTIGFHIRGGDKGEEDVLRVKMLLVYLLMHAQSPMLSAWCPDKSCAKALTLNPKRCSTAASSTNNACHISHSLLGGRLVCTVLLRQSMKSVPKATVNGSEAASLLQKRKGTEPADFIAAVGKTWPGLRVRPVPLPALYVTAKQCQPQRLMPARLTPVCVIW